MSPPTFSTPLLSPLLSSHSQDRNAATSRAKALLDDHAANLRNERTNDPNRFSRSGVGGVGGGVGGGQTYGNASLQSMLRGPVKPLSEAMESAPVRFQEVKVRPVDRQISQLRMGREGAGGSHESAPSSATAAPMSNYVDVMGERGRWGEGGGIGFEFVFG